jgi:hypothetical protein
MMRMAKKERSNTSLQKYSASSFRKEGVTRASPKPPGDRRPEVRVKKKHSYSVSHRCSVGSAWRTHQSIKEEVTQNINLASAPCG